MKRKILTPHITEKTLKDIEKNIYWFLVEKGARKTALTKELKAEYNVEPVKLNIINIPKQRIRKKMGRRIRYKTRGGIRKLRVVLKKDQKIDEFKK